MTLLIYFVLGIIFYNNIIPILNKTTSVLIDLLNLINNYCENKTNPIKNKNPIGFKAESEESQ